jgi:hypothetical protein
MIKLMDGLPDHAMGVLATGKITEADYETILIPALEEKLKTNYKIRLLYYMDSDFTGFELVYRLLNRYTLLFERLTGISPGKRFCS